MQQAHARLSVGEPSPTAAAPDFRAGYETTPNAVGAVALVHEAGDARAAEIERLLAPILRLHRLATLHCEIAAPAAHGARDGAPSRPIEAALAWLAARPEFARSSVGLFGTAAGGAEVLQMASERPGRIAAVVAHLGRPDAAGAALGRVEAPTLLIVGDDEPDALAANRRAMLQLRCRKRLEVVPGAGRAVHEPGALDAVGHLAGSWFATHLAVGRIV